MEDKYAQKNTKLRSGKGNNIKPKQTNQLKRFLVRKCRTGRAQRYESMNRREIKRWIYSVYTACGRGKESDESKVGVAGRDMSDDLVRFQNLHVMQRVH